MFHSLSFHEGMNFFVHESHVMVFMLSLLQLPETDNWTEKRGTGKKAEKNIKFHEKNNFHIKIPKIPRNIVSIVSWVVAVGRE